MENIHFLSVLQREDEGVKKERCRVGKRCLSQRGEAVCGRLEENGETRIG